MNGRYGTGTIHMVFSIFLMIHVVDGQIPRDTSVCRDTQFENLWSRQLHVTGGILTIDNY
jgi:hypothetical protein